MRDFYLVPLLLLLFSLQMGCAQPKTALPYQDRPINTVTVLLAATVEDSQTTAKLKPTASATMADPYPSSAITITPPLTTETAAVIRVTAQLLSTPTILITQTNIPSRPTVTTSVTGQDMTATPAKINDVKYVFPIQTPEGVSYGPAHHDYPATDIFAPCRVEFVAVTGGTIDEFSRSDDWDPTTNDPAQRGGRYVSIIGNDGVRYYGSHLDEVVEDLEAGMEVKAGALLGYVGNSGNARGIACHVHFGISPPTYAGDWKVRRGLVPPYEYLLAWERGENIGPDLALVTP